MSKDAVLDWLLEEEAPGVRYFALRDLLQRPPDDRELLAARRATLDQPPVRPTLEAQKPEGYWVKPGPGYGPKYRSTVFSLIFLGQYGADGSDRRIRRAVDYLFEHAAHASGALSVTGRQSGLIACAQGNLLGSLIELGFADDERVILAVDWLARYITGEGIAPQHEKKAPVHYLKSGFSGPGFPCSANDHLPCAWGAVAAVDALGKVPPVHRTPRIEQALAAGVEFLFSRDPAVADYPMGYSEKPNRSWFRFGYPLGYITDMLRLVEVLVALGHGADARLKNAFELILSKRDPEGRWTLDYHYRGKTWSNLETPNAPSKWVTLRARRALLGMSSLA